MNYARILKCDVANGPGFRTVLWTNGCTIRCKGCFNSELWDFNGGQPFTAREAYTISVLTNLSYISGLTILGGEPLAEQNIKELSKWLHVWRSNLNSGLVDKYMYFESVKDDLYAPMVDFDGDYHKTIWVYTGYVFENLTDDQKSILPYIDVLIDGPFVSELKDPSLKWRGSSNQRVIDVQESLKQNKVILYEV